MPDCQEMLHRIPLFADLPKDQVRLLAFSSARVDLEKGQMLFREGSEASGGFVVAAGVVELSREDAGDRQVQTTCEAGTLTGGDGPTGAAPDASARSWGAPCSTGCRTFVTGRPHARPRSGQPGGGRPRALRSRERQRRAATARDRRHPGPPRRLRGAGAAEGAAQRTPAP